MALAVDQHGAIFIVRCLTFEFTGYRRQSDAKRGQASRNTICGLQRKLFPQAGNQVHFENRPSRNCGHNNCCPSRLARPHSLGVNGVHGREIVGSREVHVSLDDIGPIQSFRLQNCL